VFAHGHHDFYLKKCWSDNDLPFSDGAAVASGLVGEKNDQQGIAVVSFKQSSMDSICLAGPGKKVI
jgi:hypothetical protein